MSDATVAADLLTIGHSNLPADRFIALLKDAGVSAIVDVRSVPFSRWCPWFSSKALAARLAANGMAYVQAGAGVVADSVPATEYQETRAKARAALRAVALAERGVGQ